MSTVDVAYAVGYLAGLVVSLAIVYFAVSVAKIWIMAHQSKVGGNRRKVTKK